MMSAASWIADAVLALLLIGTLAMVVRLDRALRVVRRDRGAFEALITNLGSATSAVKTGIDALRGEADRAAEQIERRSEEADKMATDLSFLIEAADRTGGKLEERMQAAAAQLQARPATPAPAPAPAPVAAEPPAPPAAPRRNRRGVRFVLRSTPAAFVPAEMAAPVAEMLPSAAPEPAETMAELPAIETPAPEPAPAPAHDLRELSGITSRRRVGRLESRLRHPAMAAATPEAEPDAVRAAAIKKAG